MTRLALVGALCLLAAGAAAVGPQASAGREASLSAIDMRPLVVRGQGFAPNERVQLVLSTGEGQRWRTTVAGEAGRFTMGFGLSVGGCGRYVVIAYGSRGSRAWLRPRGALIDCVSPDRGGQTTHGSPTT